MGCVSKKILEHVPLNWSKVASKFLHFTNNHIGKKVNRGVGLGHEISVNYFFYGDARVTTWVKNSLEKLVNDFHVEVGKCIKNWSRGAQVSAMYVFLREFDRELAGSLKKCPLLPGVLCTACPL